MIQIDCFQHLTAVAYKSGSRIMHRNTGNEADILGGKIRHQHPSHRPVDYIHAAYITGADRYVSSFFCTSRIQTGQIIRVMAEIGIHLEDIFVCVLQRPLESCDVSSTQS